MAGALPTTMAVEDMMQLAECPICFEVPRDGVMLLCVNGHNVCVSCKRRIDASHNYKCPLGRCKYDRPPRRNRTVSDLISRLPIEFKCKFAISKYVSVPGCDFTGPAAAVKDHESICEHRLVKCPNILCRETVAANEVVEHFRRAHPTTPSQRSPEPNSAEEWYLWRQSNDTLSETFSWSERPHETDIGWVFPCAMFLRGEVYIWLQMVAHIDVTKKLKCHITLGKAEFPMDFMAPVYPIDWSRRRIMHDGDCVCLPAHLVKKGLTDQPMNQQQKNAGYSRIFKITFKIV